MHPEPESLTVLAWLNQLRPAIPFSIEQPHAVMSNSELRRHLQQGAVLINGEPATATERVDFPVFSLVFFPKSKKRRTTLV